MILKNNKNPFLKIHQRELFFFKKKKKREKYRQGKVYLFDGFERERRVTIENTNRPRTLIVLKAPKRRTRLRLRQAMDPWCESKPSIESSHRSVQHKTTKEENKGRGEQQTKVLVLVVSTTPPTPTPQAHITAAVATARTIHTTTTTTTTNSANISAYSAAHRRNYRRTQPTHLAASI